MASSLKIQQKDNSAGDISTVVDTLTCAVCLEIYDQPQMLKCQHSFCRNCVKNLIKNGTVKCPTCRENTEEDEITTNRTIQEVIGCFKDFMNKPENEREECEFCEFNYSKYFCMKCKMLLCEGCRRSHVKVQKFDCKSSDADTITNLLATYGEVMAQSAAEIKKAVGYINGMIATNKEVNAEYKRNIKLKLKKAENELLSTVKRHFKEQYEALTNKQESVDEEAESLCNSMVEQLKVPLLQMEELRKQSPPRLVKTFEESFKCLAQDIHHKMRQVYQITIPELEETVDVGNAATNYTAFMDANAARVIPKLPTSEIETSSLSLAFSNTIQFVKFSAVFTFKIVFLLFCLLLADILVCGGSFTQLFFYKAMEFYNKDIVLTEDFYIYRLLPIIIVFCFLYIHISFFVSQK